MMIPALVLAASLVPTCGGSQGGPPVTVKGRVIDGAGEPVANVVVRLDRTLDARLSGDERREAAQALVFEPGERHRRVAVGAAGTYSFEGVPPGFYDLGVAQDGSTALRGGFRSSAIDSDLTRDLQLPGMLQVSGRVELAAAGPVLLALHRGEWRPGGSGFDNYVHSVELSESGAFRFSGLLPGRYSLEASGEGHGHGSLTVDLFESRADVELLVQRGRSLAGRVEAPVGYSERVWVALRQSNKVLERRGAQWWDAGEFQFSGLEPADYTLELTAFDGPDVGPARLTEQVAVRLDADVADFHYTLSARERAKLAVEWRGKAHAAEGYVEARTVGREPLRLDIRLRDDAAGGVALEVAEPGNYGTHWARCTEIVLPLTAGTWHLEAHVSGYQTWRRSVALPAQASVPLTLTSLAGQGVQSVSGADYHLLEARKSGSDEPWQQLTFRDARVWMTHSEAPEQANAWLAPGTYDLRLSTDAFTPAFLREVVVPARAQEPMVVEAPEDPGLSIAGRMLTPSGQDAGVELHLFQRQGEEWVALKTKEKLFTHYEFKFRGLTPGQYRATFDAGGEYVAAEWALTSDSLEAQRIIVGSGS